MAVSPALPPAAIDIAAIQRLQGFLQRLEPEAELAGVSRKTFLAATRGLTPDEDVLTLSRGQPEFVTPPWDYLARLVTETRIEGGRLNLARYSLPLSIIEARTGVDRYVLTAIWGIESNYGASQGDRPIVRSLATLAANDTRRAAFWKNELVQALLMVERGEVTAERLVGSWAGAMGHTQFMPSTYAAYAVDFDGDGRRDIWGRPEDGLASAGNYLKVSGWRADAPWGFEVVLPPGFDFAAHPQIVRKPLAEWSKIGVASARPARIAVAPAEPLSLLLPAGSAGPAFLVTANFDAILRYNQSVSYALAVGHLADRIAGESGLAASWPVTERLLTKTGAEELQGRLARLGFDAGPADGMIGNRTRSALRDYQISRGLVADGFVCQRVLDRLRMEPTP